MEEKEKKLQNAIDVLQEYLDACKKAITIAESDKVVQGMKIDMITQGYPFRGVRCLETIGIPEYKYVLYEFDCQPETICIVQPAFVAVVDIVENEFLGIINPYVPYDVYLTSLDIPIFEGCVEKSIVKLCIKVSLREACAEIYLLGGKLAGICAGWRVEGSLLVAEIKFSTINVGLYKLEKAKFNFEHNVVTNTGKCKYTGILYKLEGFEFKEEEKWDDQVIFEW